MSTDPTAEFDAIQRQQNQVTNQSLEATRRMLGYTTEAERMGVETMVQLDEQGEQLARIEQGLDNIHAEMDKAEENLDQLQKCCGVCVLPENYLNIVSLTCGEEQVDPLRRSNTPQFHKRCEKMAISTQEGTYHVLLKETTHSWLCTRDHEESLQLRIGSKMA